MTVAVVVGNPKPASRTLAAAELVAQRLTGAPADLVIDVVTLGPGLLGWGDPGVAAAVEAVRKADVLVCQFPADSLAGVTAFPLMLGAGPGHALAPELLLRPVLVELGASCPARGLYLLDSHYTEESRWATWLGAATRVLPRERLSR
jgi:FMN reductase